MPSHSAASAPLTSRFFVVLGLVCVLIGSGFLLLIFGPASYEQLLALDRHSIYEGGYQPLPLALTPARYQLLRGGLAALAGLSGSLLLGLWHFRQAEMRDGIGQLGQQLRRAVAALGDTVCQLSGPEKLTGASLLALLLAVRLWFLPAYALDTDEVASYDFFVRPGLLSISSFYPIPNNHLLFNLLCWPLTFLTDNVRLVMRLPTFAASAVGTGLGYVLLTRWVSFRAATLAIGLFGFRSLSVYYAMAGRGYFLQLTLLILAFFAVVAVLHHPKYRALGWVLFVGASILGFYTIPTFLYPFISLVLGLLLGLGRQRRWSELAYPVLASGIVGLVSALLYWPVVCVSGLDRLVGNRYVAELAPSVFWPGYWRYLHVLTDVLAADGRLGMALAGGLLLLGPVLLFELPRPARTVELLAWLLLGMPLLLMAVQQVYMPPRALFYTSFFGCVLGGWATVQLLTRLRFSGRNQLLAILLLLACYGSYQLQQHLALQQRSAREEQETKAAYSWLTQRGAVHMLVAAPTYELFFRHYAQQEHRSILLHATPAPSQTYDFLVQAHHSEPLPAWAQVPFYTRVYEDRFVVIYHRSVGLTH